MENIHPILKNLIAAAPHFRVMRKNNYMIGITDREKTLRFFPNDVIDLNIEPDTMLPAGDPMLEVMKTGEMLEVKVEKSLYGIAFKATYRPVKDENGAIIGGIALGRELEVEEELIDISKLLFKSVERIDEALNQISIGAEKQMQTSEMVMAASDESVKKQEETDNILSFIKNVAKQTNLLSLNAQIEAARAGSSGKGFRIVANEMKKLGNSSSQAANDIQSKLNDIKSSNEKLRGLSNENCDNASAQSGAIQEILSSINEVSNAVSVLQELSNKL